MRLVAELLGHLIFCMVHVGFAMFTCGGSLLFSIPMHLIYAGMMQNADAARRETRRARRYDD